MFIFILLQLTEKIIECRCPCVFFDRLKNDVTSHPYLKRKIYIFINPFHATLIWIFINPFFTLMFNELLSLTCLNIYIKKTKKLLKILGSSRLKVSCKNIFFSLVMASKDPVLWVAGIRSSQWVQNLHDNTCAAVCFSTTCMKVCKFSLMLYVYFCSIPEQYG